MKRNMPLHQRILLGLVVGAAAGVAVNLAATRWPGLHDPLENLIQYVTYPLGQVFLRLLFMTVVPLVLATLATGVARLGDLRKLGRIGLRTMAYFFVTTALAVVVGLTVVSLIQPGVGFDAETQARLLETHQSSLSDTTRGFAERGGFGVDTLLRIIPRNPLAAMAEGDMLAVILFALLLGVAATRITPERAARLVGVLDALADAVIVLVGLTMRLAPLAVPALIFNVTARFGLDLLEKLSLYVLSVGLGYAVFLFGVYPLILKLVLGVSPGWFLRRAAPVMVTAFSTSSSNATLPTSLKTAEEDLGVPADVAGFVLPLGATLNMNGTSLFEGVTVLFLAQVFGVPVGLFEQALVVLLAVLMAVGTAGVPGASIPMIMLVLTAVGIPPEGIAIILGVDRLLDMGRTVLNVTGDLTAAVFIARLEGVRVGSSAMGD